jgi:Icc-related predicted phosphoesterase
MIIRAISDTHNYHNRICPVGPCGVLIHAGDSTGLGRESEVRNFAKWFNKQDARHKIWVPGNHEKEFERDLPLSLTWFTDHCPDGIILMDQEVVIDGIKFYGTPVSPFFHNWAFNKFPMNIQPHWDAIPDDVNVLITHCPPKNILDVGGWPQQELGCPALKSRLSQLKSLKVHFFGHIHEQGGKSFVDQKGVQYYNVSVCDEHYNVVRGYAEVKL